jgi:hypothetical protein
MKHVLHSLIPRLIDGLLVQGRPAFIPQEPSGNFQDFTTTYSTGTADNGNVQSFVAVGSQQNFNRTYG